MAELAIVSYRGGSVATNVNPSSILLTLVPVSLG